MSRLTALTVPKSKSVRDIAIILRIVGQAAPRVIYLAVINSSPRWKMRA
jgi:hypothetical protein